MSSAASRWRLNVANRNARPKSLDALCKAEIAQWPVEVAEAVAIGQPVSREQLAARLQWALRTLATAAHDNKAVNAKTRDRAISIVAVVLGLDPSLKPREERTPEGERKSRSVVKLDRLADRLITIGTYLKKVSTQQARKSGKAPGHHTDDPAAMIGLRTVLQTINEKIESDKLPKASLLLRCRQAATRFADQEGIADKIDRMNAIRIWTERLRAHYRAHPNWRPVSLKDAILVADKVKRGVRIGAKLPPALAD
jgi:hypothetical protein